MRTPNTETGTVGPRQRWGLPAPPAPSAAPRLRPRNNRLWHWAALALVLLSGISARAQASGLAINWFTLSGGGGTSAGGGYALSGSIGQADTGAMGGGSYTLQGGFWSGVTNAVPSPNVTLQAQRVGMSVQLTWSQGTLLQADQLTGPWTTNTALSPYLVTPTALHKFYRVCVQ